MILDLKLVRGRVVTMDPLRPTATTVGVWRGRVVGLDEDVADLPAARTVDLDGATVLPGFIDAHTHLAWAGRARRTIDVSQCVTVDQILDALRGAPGQGWIEGTGYDRRAVPLTAADLDTVSADRNIYVQDLSGHACVVNSVVLKQLPGIVSDGWLTETDRAAAHALLLPYSIDALSADLRHSVREVLSQGITMCAEAGVGAGLLAGSPVEVAAYQRANLPIRVQLMVSADVLHAVNAHQDDGITRAIDLGLHTGFGGDRLSIGALKVWTDGGMMARTAALTEPYEGTDNTGELLDERAAILDGHAAGWQLAVHAIGDRAVDFALDTLAEAQARAPRPDARHRIEHCGLVRPDQLRRIAELGVIPVIQPAFLWSYGDDYAAIMGARRAPWMYRGRSFLDHGITIAGSSDRPVADGAPLRAIEFMVERQSAGGMKIGPGEEITVEEALAAYTAGGAYACRMEHDLGSVTPGKLADFVVLADDPRTAPRVAAVPVVATIVGGEVVHGAV
ncbi:Exoenzymes regulatory protein AepA in lipid-linked oligosaccharide synthesis cluster [Alloactinosynnema sp. L-07]|uniref:amidohydrolase n=1 Tax=Alloactinosynnema sp. L-07 TaxID=1653480 RepID=UPI00065F081C|nr:amidohydrolase [Alloactinosynnema sp. L-07]CRK56489.1 Exoenzymes regulatory protein AepA in lipid-linked oligosaccharide synthesis cluster [Alloactinosynnema sp. L-07]